MVFNTGGRRETQKQKNYTVVASKLDAYYRVFAKCQERVIKTKQKQTHAATECVKLTYNRAKNNLILKTFSSPKILV